MLARQRSKVLIAAAVLSVVGLSTVIAVTGGFTKNEAATAASLPQNSSQPAPVAAVQSELPVHKIAAETVAKSTRAATERTVNQSRDADREWACVESVHR
jgi:hypothetical protein